MKRNPHPARGSRVTALGVSATAFVSIVSSLAWNTHQAEAAAIVPNPNTAPIGQTTPVNSGTSAVVPAATPVPVAIIAPVVPATPTISSNSVSPTKTNKTSAPAVPKVAPAKPAAPISAPTTAAPAPAKPAPTVIYTCMSPGGTTANPTGSGNCRSGYTLTKI
jgi:hypothetical protein